MTDLIRPKIVLNNVIDTEQQFLTFQMFKDSYYDIITTNQNVKYKLDMKYKRPLVKPVK
jgi:hypothetical protein